MTTELKQQAHTPGPWIAESNGEQFQVAAYGVNTYDTILRIKFLVYNTDRVESDCKLIAAAPELLEALQAAQELDDRIVNCENCFEGIFPECCEECLPFADKARLLRIAAIAKATGSGQ